MPFGYLITVGVFVVGMLLAVAPLGRSGARGILSWWLSAFVNESPFIGLYWVLGATVLEATQGGLDTAVLAGLGLAAVSFAAITPVLVRRSLRARSAVEHALDDGLGAGWRSVVMPTNGNDRRRPRWLRVVLAPVPLFSPGVERVRGRSYGPYGRRNQLDVYRSREGVSGAPVLIHLHGGGFSIGRKSFYARALIHELARDGWLCISANYRLRPASFSDFMVDVKRLVAWTREHGEEYGADPDSIVLAGSSAGAHLAISAALTANVPAFQPGFPHSETSVRAAVGLYGYYGRIEPGPEPSSPGEFAHPDAPPIFIAHGDQDTFVPPHQARHLFTRLRDISDNPVVYAELPGAQHSFDLLRSFRFEILIDGIKVFAEWALTSTPRVRPGPRETTSSG